MGWAILNVSLSVNATSMPCEDGNITATVTVTGQTDDKKEVNTYTASIRDDYVIPDILWESGPQSADVNAHIEQSFTVELSCDKKCKVVGPNGSSGERIAELYAYVIGGGREGASDEIPVTCVR
jgi:hypothetical protein